jgi:NAD(P)-dependent dehydrogenase (short-subunit alcohol dehydrogenase family)
MTTQLDDKVVLVTGAAGGIGQHLVATFLQAGATVAATDVQKKGLAHLRDQATRAGYAGRLSTTELDVSDAAACAACIEDLVAQNGRIDALVNNAALGMGFIRDDHMSNLVGIEEVSPEVWDKFVSVNLSGAWYLTRFAYPHMRDRGHGRIINVSTSFFTMLRGGFHPYGPAKAAMESMAFGHAAEFAGTGVTVNIVVPGGPTDTPMVPAVAPYERANLISPAAMAPPMTWIIGTAGDEITGQRYVAAEWDLTLAPEAAAQRCGAPAAWPELAANPVWPGGQPSA